MNFGVIHKYLKKYHLQAVCFGYFVGFSMGVAPGRNLHREKNPVPSLVPFKRTVRSKPGKLRKGGAKGRNKT